jgi:hypothetical protein
MYIGVMNVNVKFPKIVGTGILVTGISCEMYKKILIKNINVMIVKKLCGKIVGTKILVTIDVCKTGLEINMFVLSVVKMLMMSVENVSVIFK